MSANPTLNRENSTRARAEWMDSVCDRFESALQSGERPAVERYLEDTTEPVRSTLRSELLALANDYLPRIRCPHCQSVIERSAQRHTSEIVCGQCECRFQFVGDGASSNDPLALRKKIAHYELIRPLGSGRFGAVWLASDTRKSRLVAIKVPRGDRVGPLEEARFQREAQAASHLSHPNIVGLYDVGRDNGLLFMASQYVPGGTLAGRMKTEQPTPHEAAELCVKIADALEFAHAAGIVHRDVNPANILLDENDQPQIADFGMARQDVDDVTVTCDGEVFGTPAYMSPEQARGDGFEADCRTDVYSIGVILYRLLTGSLPFQGSIRMTLRQVIEEQPRCPSDLNDHVPAQLESICLKAMEKEPAWRYDSAAELAADLRRFLDGQPVHARPQNRFVRLWQWAKRPARIAEAGAVLQVITGLQILLTLLGIVAFSIGLAGRTADITIVAKLLLFSGVVYLPAYLIGYATKHWRSLPAIWLGFVTQWAVFLIWFRLTLNGGYQDYLGLAQPNHPEERLKQCIMFASMGAITCLYYSLAVIAYYSNRSTLKLQRNDPSEPAE